MTMRLKINLFDADGNLVLREGERVKIGWGMGSIDKKYMLVHTGNYVGFVESDLLEIPS